MDGRPQHLSPTPTDSESLPLVSLADAWMDVHSPYPYWFLEKREATVHHSARWLALAPTVRAARRSQHNSPSKTSPDSRARAQKVGG
jgi:hypothetical protein